MKKFLLPILLLIFYIGFVFLTYKQYAITSDEFSSYISGQIWSEYFQNEEITYNLARYHPLVNEHYRFYSMILFLIIGSLKYEFFHLLNGLAFIPVLIASFVLTKYVKPKSNWLYLIPAGFILLTPRVLGDIFNNPKDMPFAILYFVTIASIFLFKENPDKWNNNLKVIILGILIGITQSLRPLGFGLYFVYIIWNWPNDFKNKKQILRLALETLNLSLIGFFVMAVTWPAIGANFGANLKKYLSLGVDFNLWEGEVFYLGKQYQANNLPWHYLIIWLLITLPLTHIFLFISGIYSALKKISNTVQRFFYIVIGLNILLYFVLKPSLYNGIRHYDFLVILISFIAGINFVEWVKNFNRKKITILVGVSAIYSIILLRTIWQLFPYPNLYFNELVGGTKGAQSSFDLDYWDTTYKSAAEYLRINIISNNLNQNEKITVYSCGARTALDYYMGSQIEQKKNPSEATYVICDPQGFNNFNNTHSILTRIEKAGTTVIVIGKR